MLFSLAAMAILQKPAVAGTLAAGGINVEPSARPWHYLGANPDSWWCPTAATCTTSNPLARIDTEMALAKQLHVANVRLEIPWFLVEPAKGTYDWTRADYIFNSATAHGIVIQPILVYTPAWDGGYNVFPVAADFQAFVDTFMRRYGSRINAVEMWNEPDGGQSLVSNNPALYVQDILIPGYRAVKATFPSVSVIEGGSINDSGVCCPWLTGIYNAGGGAYFDIAAFHDYGGNYGQIAQTYHSVLSAHGQGGKPVWMGEYGVSDATGSQQSSLVQAALTATPGLAMAQFYTLRDESVYNCCPPATTGERKQYGVLLADDVTKKVSFGTMQSLLAGVPPPPAPAPTTAPTAPPTSAPTAQPTTAPTAQPTAPPAPAPAPQGTTVGGLHVVGNHIVDANGNVVTLHGANMSGTEFVCAQGWSADPFGGQPEDNAQTFAAMHAWHINAVRVPLNEDCWLGINGARIGGAAYQTAIMKLVHDLRAAGFYVIVDLHWSAPGSQLALSQNPVPDQDHSPAFWQSVAATFMQDQGVIYDLFNEPFLYWIASGGPDQWGCLMNGCTLTQYETGGTPFTVTASWRSAGMNQLIGVVRATGAQNVVMVSGVNWARDLSGWLANRPAGSNIAAAWHSYPSANPSLVTECAAQSCWDTVIAPVAARVPVVVGETGDSAAGPETYLPGFLPWAAGHGLNVIAWTWNAWNNPDDVLVTNMTTGNPTGGEGVVYRGWLSATPVPNAAPAQPVYSTPPATQPAPVSNPVAAAPGHGGATSKTTSPAHTSNPPHRGPITTGPLQGAAGMRSVASPKTLQDRLGMEVIYVGFALLGLAALIWGVSHLAVTAGGHIQRTVGARA